MKVLSLVAEYFTFLILFEFLLRLWRAEQSKKLIFILIGSVATAVFLELSAALSLSLICAGALVIEPYLSQRRILERSKIFDHSYRLPFFSAVSYA